MTDSMVMLGIVITCALIAFVIGYVTLRVINHQLSNANGDLVAKLGRAEGTERRLQVRQMMIAASACPMCEAEVMHAREVDLIEQPPDAVPRPGVVVAGSASTVRMIVLFDPCGCVWDPFEANGQSGAGRDLLCILVDEPGDLCEAGPGRFKFELRPSPTVPSHIVFSTSSA